MPTRGTGARTALTTMLKFVLLFFGRRATGEGEAPNWRGRDERLSQAELAKLWEELHAPQHAPERTAAR